MGSRSTRTKLKILFIATLLLLGVTVPTFVYVQSLIPKPARFQVSDLTLDQDWIQFGDPVQISVNVTNVGDEAGNYTVIVTIDDEPIASKTVQLSGKESTIVDATATGVAEGEHTVKVGDLTAPLKVTSDAPTRPAKMEITNLGISRTQAGVGETITVSVLAKNIGDVTGDFSLELFVNDEKRETKNIQLDGGETTTVPFELIENAVGDYEVKLGDLTTSFKITTDAQPIKPAEFQVTGLTVNTRSVLAGETVDISVTVTNVGEATGSYTLNLNIAGATRETRDVTLSGKASEVVVFEVSETNEGTHTVEICNQSGLLIVESPVSSSADIKIYSVSIAPEELRQGEIVTITAKADNPGNAPGTFQATVFVNGEIETTPDHCQGAGLLDADETSS